MFSSWLVFNYILKDCFMSVLVGFLCFLKVNLLPQEFTPLHVVMTRIINILEIVKYEWSWRKQVAVSWFSWSALNKVAWSFFLCRAKSDPEISGSLMESSQQSGTLSKKDTARPTALLPAFRLILCVFGVTLADGDGVQEHLLPVCEDDACQRSAIYLSKSGSAEVLDVCIMNLVTCYTLFSMFLLFFYSPFKCDTNQLLFTAFFFWILSPHLSTILLHGQLAHKSDF